MAFIREISSSILLKFGSELKDYCRTRGRKWTFSDSTGLVSGSPHFQEMVNRKGWDRIVPFKVPHRFEKKEYSKGRDDKNVQGPWLER